MLGNTPMMQQYQLIKKQYPDTILFFRLGDFYEMFAADAELASRELEIVLTGRDAGMESRVPMCGVPYHAAENYIAKLIQKGYKVAICEQMEDPRQCKGIVKREVIRVITPGTNLDTPLLNSPSNTYLAALSFHEQVWGLAFCDVSTGEFRATEFFGPDGTNTLIDELYRLHPVEILVPDDFENNIATAVEGMLITTLNQDFFSYSKTIHLLREHLRLYGQSAQGFDQSKQAISCAGAILKYLIETQKAPPQQIKAFERYYIDAYMMLDATTFKNLEITRTIRTNEKKGSLYDLLDRTKTAPGSRMLRNWLERPLNNKDKLEERLYAVEEYTKHWSERQTARKYLAEVYDLERLMTRILYKRANPKELISLKNSLAVLPQLKTLAKALTGSSYLSLLLEDFDPLTDVFDLLEQALVNDPPHNLKDGGIIKPGYNPEIDSLRRTSKHGKDWIARLEAEEKEKTGIKSLKIGFNKVFGYYLEVTKSNYALVPDYFQRKQTLANAERYITDELIRLENEVLGAEEKLLALEEEVYMKLLELLGTASQRVQQTTHILAQLDVLQSLAEIAVQNSYVCPELRESGENVLFLQDLRHPVVEKTPGLAAFVPNDLHMDETTNLHIITGPNMGGKSTYCRSVALCVIMAQAGSFVPARAAVISLRDRVFARVGASDDLRSGQSTFMVEMNEVSNILRYATLSSLVILDEVGRGTSTYDGLSMAWAVSEYLVKHLHTKTLFATHYHELTQLAKLFPAIKNLSLSVKEAGEEIVFLHKIISGPADKSYGIHVGRLAGLPQEVIDRANEILENLEREGLNGNSAPKAELPEDKNIPENKNTPEDKRNSDKSNTTEIPQEVAECLEIIMKLDAMSTTPLEALNSLYELQQKLKRYTGER